MQALNKKPLPLHYTPKKFNSCDDCKDNCKVPSKEFIKQLTVDPNSFLARRRRQTGFSLAPIDTKLNKRKDSSHSFSELIHEMKVKVSNCDNESYQSHCHGEEDYLFVNPQSNHSHPQSEEELRISSFLNSFGIFQLNLGVALKDYNF